MAVFDKSPTSEAITAELDKLIDKEGCKPKHIVVDHGPQFDCEHFRDWCKGHDIKYRFGTLEKHGSIAVVERFNRSMKDECTRRIMVPTDKAEFETELSSWRTCYNIHRPHMRHEGRTPEEIFGHDAASWKPRIEPRPDADQNMPCARPRVAIDGQPGTNVLIAISYHEGRRHLPIIQVTRV